MKVIVAGSRTITTRAIVDLAINASGFRDHITEIVSGGAKGVDQTAEKWARRNEVPVKVFPAKWDLHGKSAGIIRNKEMADYADALVAVWDGRSRGTLSMIWEAHQQKLHIHIRSLRWEPGI